MAKKKVREIGSNMKKDEAKKWIKKYQKKNKDKVHGWLYGMDILQKLEKYEGAEGIWFFKGIADDDSERLVMFAADKDGNILGSNSGESDLRNASFSGSMNSYHG